MDPITEAYNEAIAPKQVDEGSGFYRLPKKVIGNDLYRAKQKFDALYSSLKHGNDFDEYEFKALISQLTNINKKAKKFQSADDVTSEYL